MTVTKEDFQAYVRVQMSGRTNMFMVSAVEKLSGLSRATILDIMKNYAKYEEEFAK